MKKLFTLSAIAALAVTSLGVQAQFTVDGTLSPAEVGTGAGKYQLLGTYTGTHSVTDRGLKSLYVGNTATTLNIMVVASAETPSYDALVLYLDAPKKTGIPAGTRLAGGNDGSTPFTSPLVHRPTLDMPVDYAFRVTLSPLNDPNNAAYFSRVDYTAAATSAGGYPENPSVSAQKDGTIVDAPDGIVTAYATSATGSVTVNTTTGWEFEIPLSALGGAATGDVFRVMTAFVLNNTSFTTDVLPQITGQTTALGPDPNFSTIAGDQFYTYTTTGAALASHSASAAALQAAAYPNPVAADSRLAYTVPNAAQPVIVDVYNSLGQKALSLLNRTEAAGRHNVDLSALQRLAAGPYLVTLRVGNQLSRHRVVVQ